MVILYFYLFCFPYTIIQFHLYDSFNLSYHLRVYPNTTKKQPSNI